MPVAGVGFFKLPYPSFNLPEAMVNPNYGRSLIWRGPTLAWSDSEVNGARPH
ncbi:hypothetical protein ASZ90_018901 [hydrocarbon metagenome]|uniref:Uncharacterized protein n=1 Tax=hydrocarbon metagenome TaxID=938273 RepID=A0A0W8E4S2_9ZZZZ